MCLAQENKQICRLVLLTIPLLLNGKEAVNTNFLSILVRFDEGIKPRFSNSMQTHYISEH